MPLYEYACAGCGQLVELLVRGDEQPACSSCGSDQLDRQLSVIASPSSSSRLEMQRCDSPAPAPGCGLPQCGTGGCQFG